MLDLEKIAKHVDEVLANETPESLMEWLDNYRLQQKLLNMANETDETISLEELEKLLKEGLTEEEVEEFDQAVEEKLEQLIEKHEQKNDQQD